LLQGNFRAPSSPPRQAASAMAYVYLSTVLPRAAVGELQSLGTEVDDTEEEDVDTEVDTEEDPEEEQQVVVPQALGAQSCPLLALLAAPPEPWEALVEREKPEPGFLPRLALDTEALDEEIFEALNEAAEAELDDAWNRARAAVSHTGLPIVFEFLEEERLFEFALVERAPAFCVGATQDPLRRWVGDVDGGEQRGPMPGHRDAGWNELRVVHVAHGGAAASLEARLIREAMERHPGQCRNAVPDARGLQRRAINFVYIVV
jgi:hypothetical protein